MSEIRGRMLEEVKELIEAFIALYCSGAGGWLAGFEEIARIRQLLPIHLELFIMYFVSPTGEMYSCDVLQEIPTLLEVENRAERISVLLPALKEIPELSVFLHEKERAEVCRACGGSRKLPFEGEPGFGGKVACPECGGMGWTDAVASSDG